MQLHEAIKDQMEITLFVGERNNYDISNISLDIKRLKHKQEIMNGLLNLADVKRRHKKTVSQGATFISIH